MTNARQLIEQAIAEDKADTLQRIKDSVRSLQLAQNGMSLEALRPFIKPTGVVLRQLKKLRDDVKAAKKPKSKNESITEGMSANEAAYAIVGHRSASQAFEKFARGTRWDPSEIENGVRVAIEDALASFR